MQRLPGRVGQVKHLMDSREPITLADIDQAMEDARAWLPGAIGGTAADLVSRLLAIVEYAYRVAGSDDD